MKAPRFWFREGGAVPRLLAPASHVYGFVAGLRSGRRPSARAETPVICIGNPTVGGAGKTPACLRIAEMLTASGRRPVFLTRGYGGREKGPLLVDETMSADDVGDEAILLAAKAPTVVSADRVKGAGLAAEHGDVIVMDDGFQNPRLHKDLSILVIDGATGVGNGRVFPAGPLRMRLARQLDRAQALLVVGAPTGAARAIRAAERRGLSIVRAELRPTETGRARLSGRRVYAFAGIGRPEKFFASLESAGAELAGTWAFGDHHRYTAAEAAAILDQARELEAVPVTTEKDAARLGGDQPEDCRELRRTLETLPVELVVDEADAPRLYGLVAAACETAEPDRETNVS